VINVSISTFEDPIKPDPREFTYGETREFLERVDIKKSHGPLNPRVNFFININNGALRFMFLIAI